jgi:hypothetical protein
MLDPISNISYSSILFDISNFFCSSLLTRKQISTGREYYTITASNKKSLSIIINYFNSFPLLSSKLLDYKDWAMAALLILNDLHLNVENKANIDILKYSMNRNRLCFNWDHLNIL